MFVLTQLFLTDDFHLKTICQFWETRLFKIQVCILAITVILLKLRGKKAHDNGTGKCPVCRLLTCTLFWVIRLTGIKSCSEIKPAVITMVVEAVQPDNHCTRTQKHKEHMQKQARVPEGKIQAASRGKQVPTKRPAAPGSGHPAPRRLLGWRPLELF